MKREGAVGRYLSRQWAVKTRSRPRRSRMEVRRGARGRSVVRPHCDVDDALAASGIYLAGSAKAPAMEAPTLGLLGPEFDVLRDAMEIFRNPVSGELPAIRMGDEEQREDRNSG
jgi:hypothetical protein